MLEIFFCMAFYKLLEDLKSGICYRPRESQIDEKRKMQFFLLSLKQHNHAHSPATSTRRGLKLSSQQTKTRLHFHTLLDNRQHNMFITSQNLRDMNKSSIINSAHNNIRNLKILKESSQYSKTKNGLSTIQVRKNVIKK